MNTILLLKEKTESVDRVSRNPLRLRTHADDATAGSTCDRWGHPCPDCVQSKPQARTTRRKFSLIKNEVNKNGILNCSWRSSNDGTVCRDYCALLK